MLAMRILCRPKSLFGSSPIPRSPPVWGEESTAAGTEDPSVHLPLPNVNVAAAERARLGSLLSSGGHTAHWRLGRRQHRRPPLEDVHMDGVETATTLLSGERSSLRRAGNPAP